MEHYSVLLRESIDKLNIKKDGVYIDATLGLGGHTEAIATLCSDGQVISFDQDSQAMNHAKERLKHFNNIIFILDNFKNIKSKVNELGFKKVDGIIYDLGTSYFQLTDKNRGFTYHGDTTLDMRMNLKQKISAINIINEYSEEELSRVFKEYGDEKKHKLLASKIIEARNEKKITSNVQLNNIIKDVKGWNKDKHPSKNIYQSIRIEVNKEIDVLKTSITNALELLQINGRLVVITFHSLEDKTVKDMFFKAKNEEIITQFGNIKYFNTHKTIYPKDDEIKQNNPSRSAKLRIITKKYEK